MILRPISTLVTAAAVEPITTAQAKLFLRVDHDTDDALIDGMITTARQWIESYTRRSLTDQVYDLAYGGWFALGAPLYLPHAPLVAAADVASVKYYDENDELQTLDASYYTVRASAGAFAGRAYIEYAGLVLPTLSSNIEHPVVVRATCGYGAAATDVPKGIVSALYLMIGELYEQRQESVIGVSVAKAAITVKHLLDPYRLKEFA